MSHIVRNEFTCSDYGILKLNLRFYRYKKKQKNILNDKNNQFTEVGGWEEG